MYFEGLFIGLKLVITYDVIYFFEGIYFELFDFEWHILKIYSKYNL